MFLLKLNLILKSISRLYWKSTVISFLFVHCSLYVTPKHFDFGKQFPPAQLGILLHPHVLFLNLNWYKCALSCGFPPGWSVLVARWRSGQLRSWGFESRLCPVCTERACSPRASSVSSEYSGFLCARSACKKDWILKGFPWLTAILALTLPANKDFARKLVHIDRTIIMNNSRWAFVPKGHAFLKCDKVSYEPLEGVLYTDDITDNVLMATLYPWLKSL